MGGILSDIGDAMGLTASEAVPLTWEDDPQLAGLAPQSAFAYPKCCLEDAPEALLQYD